MKCNKQLKYSNHVAFSHFHGAAVNNSGAVIGNHILRLYEKLDSRAEINSSFVEEEIRVASVSIGAGKLEDYFKELVGGNGIG